ncbi:cbb3-type cytochrome oxidase assembly protein CcoS [Microbulbifer magnicolonia]|uniref:cbb3-type cytochrome oxidase assembly protein CcoS n=1 Tax=Microbulbifer magnicolonia TaxID=3109744 RepID=UPI002B40ABB0|nr:cbb3-type cytochrome oxidase assembly protein CcoS [Microbulbifer sp. GG15]
MDSLYFLIPIAILFVGAAVKLFFWAVNNGQYDDLDTEGRRILFDDDEPREDRCRADLSDNADDDGEGER